ncbi:MAG: glycine--tRNA ligase subunit alpha [Holosporaceae bacterium]|jgi:glycyl-tRNA synthetase alpha chain|nr:glycine--tRNA ligase subunit alpha [Holosporaceae bacterium]
MSFQDIIISLQQYWSSYGCALLQPHDVEVGAGTFSPHTLIRALGKDSWRAAYVQPSRRPADGRYGNNPNRVQKHHQFQAIIKPFPSEIRNVYLHSLAALGIDNTLHDIRFVEDDWESPTLGAAGLGWEVWCDGMEITQFTYFQQVGGYTCDPVMVELTYGLERLAMFLQNVDNVYDLNWNGKEGVDRITYRDVCLQQEQEFSEYSFKLADVDQLKRHFVDAEVECYNLLKYQLVLPAYDQCIKASHVFNLMDARGALSVVERVDRIARVRALVKMCCEAQMKKLEKSEENEKMDDKK